MTGDFSSKLDEILKNPSMLAQIKALADTMTAGKAEEPPPEEPSVPPPAPVQTQPAMEAALPTLLAPSPSLQKNLTNTRALLIALKPFLDDKRCGKIDKMLSMMRLAEMAGQFGSFL